MSTKVYDGCRIGSTISLTSLAREISSRMEVVYLQETVRAMAVVSAVLLSDDLHDSSRDVHSDLTAGLVKRDDLRVGGTSVLAQSARLVDLASERARQRSRRLSYGLDRDVSVVFLSDPEDARWTYAIIYSECSAYKDVWYGIDGVEPWPYWNNTDGPDDVSQSEWDERGAAWGRVLGYEPPVKTGLQWSIERDDAELMVMTGDVGAEDVASLIWSSVKPEGRERLGGSVEGLAAMLEAAPDGG